MMDDLDRRLAELTKITDQQIKELEEKADKIRKHSVVDFEAIKKFEREMMSFALKILQDIDDENASKPTIH